MPHSAFFNLPKEKQQTIITCAYKEFGNNTYDKVSVFLIAKNANISRASFYCYFDDKEDIYNYLIKLILAPYRENLLKQYKEIYLFNLANNLFNYFLSFHKTEQQDFIVNILRNMNPKTIKFICNDLSEKKLEESKNINIITDNLNIKSNYDLNIISFTILLNMAVCLTHYFTGLKTKEQAQEYFNRTLDIIKNGAFIK